MDTSDYRFVRDERYEVAPKARAGVFSAEERALSRDRRAIVGATLKLPVRAETRPPPRLDLGERDRTAADIARARGAAATASGDAGGGDEIESALL